MKVNISLAATVLTIAAAQVSAQSTSSLEQDRKILQDACQSLNRLLKYSPTCGLPPLALALFFRQVSVS